MSCNCKCCFDHHSKKDCPESLGHGSKEQLIKLGWKSSEDWQKAREEVDGLLIALKLGEAQRKMFLDGVFGK